MENDDHPYRTGAWKPNDTEYDATDLDVVSGEIPKDLEGIYLRNTENPVLPAIGRYHPFDGDGMVHAIHAFRKRQSRLSKSLRAHRGARGGDRGWRAAVGGHLRTRPSKSKREGR